MIKVYNSAGWVDGIFEVVGRRDDQPYPKAYLLRTCKSLHDGSSYFVAYFCAERKTESFEHLDFACQMPTFATREEAFHAARAQGFTL